MSTLQLLSPVGSNQKCVIYQQELATSAVCSRQERWSSHHTENQNRSVVPGIVSRFYSTAAVREVILKYYSGLGARAVPGILLPVVEQLFEINHLAVSQQWAKSQGCPWDFLKVTARRGHFEVLQCARGQGRPWGGGSKASAYGATAQAPQTLNP